VGGVIEDGLIIHIYGDGYAQVNRPWRQRFQRPAKWITIRLCFGSATSRTSPSNMMA